MTAPAVVSLEEYLRTSYRPDCEYVDGEILERKMGEHDHSDLQTEIAYYFRARRKQWRLHAVVEQRVQVSADRYRIPDVCVVRSSAPHPAVFRDPPFICIEVLSKDDSLTSVQERMDDYLRFGVPNVWLFDPAKRRAWIYRPGVNTEVLDGVLRSSDSTIEILLAELFAGLDGE